MRRSALLITALVALASCGAPETREPGEAAQEFSERINGSRPANEAAPPAQSTGQVLPSPTVVPPREASPQAAPAPLAPVLVSCRADAMGPFLGREADQATRLDIMSAARGASDVRFVAPGSEFIPSDPTNPRLNIMLDSQGVIRDAKCG